ncbi:MAG: MBL fold metallo-hydrolase [Acidobacteriota bacterium]
MDETADSLYEQLLTRGHETAGDKPPRSSAAVVPWRLDEAGEVEVYWVRRSPTMRFMGGFYAFPGGGLARSDAAVPVAAPPDGASGTTFCDAEPGMDAARREQLGPDLAPGLVACTLRELFEETGLLLANPASEATPIDTQELPAQRQRLLDKQIDFAGMIEEQGWQLDASPLVFAGRWLTPPLAPMRFDNRFFLLPWPRSQAVQPSLMGGELDRGEWIRPLQALERWRRGELMTAPPILHILRVLAEEAPAEALPRLLQPDEANLGPLRRIEFRPGVILLPLLTPTLPPATRTNAYILGTGRAVLVDPATPFADETDRLRQALDAARSKGLEIQAIWLTHHHPDHIGAAETMRRELDVPICAHPLTADRLHHSGLRVDRELGDDQIFDLGGDAPFPVRVVHTPGHARGHLCFFDETYRSLVAGDLVSTLSTIVIDPPEGDMDDYIDSLDRAAALSPNILFPAHGPPVPGAVRRLGRLKQHRLDREEQILNTWQSGTTDPAAMVAEIYADVPRPVHLIAERQLQAHLTRLRRLGKLGVKP